MIRVRVRVSVRVRVRVAQLVPARPLVHDPRHPTP